MAKALEGKTDLDILVHKEDKDKFEEALKKFDFKLILSPLEKRFPGLEDYLGFDYETGRLIHLHVHYNLILGQRYIKNHHLPIEKMVLKKLTTQDNVFIPIPELELIMLIIRAHMKIDIFSLIKQCIKDFSQIPYTPFPSHIEEELSDLIRKSDIVRLKELLPQSELPLPEELFTGFIARYSDQKIHAFTIIRDCCRIFSALKGFRRRSSLGMYIEYAYRALWDLPIINRLNRVRPLKKKTLPGRGIIFALVGADGSGKSTLIQDLDKWLSWKLSVRRVYYGIPKNKFIEIISKLIYGFKKFKMEWLSSVLDACLWILIARKRYVISLRVQEDSNKGNIVISDRFPLKEFHTMAQPMDGPRLKDRTTLLGSLFSSVENRYYHSIQLPDRIFVLKVDLNEVRKRKSDLDLDTHRMKVDAVNTLVENDTITTIDANRPYQAVQLDVKRLIWKDLI